MNLNSAFFDQSRVFPDKQGIPGRVSHVRLGRVSVANIAQKMPKKQMRYQPTNSVWSCKKVGTTGIDSFAYNHKCEGFATTENPAPRSSILLHFT